MSESIQPFVIEVSDATLADLRERLARTRFPDQIEGANWDYGTELSYLRELVAYWKDHFDWRAQERLLNSFPHFQTSIDDHRVHFIHARSPHENAFPLVVTHGWPGSVFEFHKILGPLTNPTQHGGNAADAFHVVCPSIPGYGFSEPPRTRGWDVRRMAEVNAKLMAKLGYAKYGAQGGDWGAIISVQNALVDKLHCAGIHLNMVVAFPAEGMGPDAMKGLDADEIKGPAISATSRRTRPATSRSRAPSPRRSATDSPIRPRAWRRGSSRNSVPGATAVATSRSASRRTSCSPT